MPGWVRAGAGRCRPGRARRRTAADRAAESPACWRWRRSAPATPAAARARRAAARPERTIRLRHHPCAVRRLLQGRQIVPSRLNAGLTRPRKGFGNVSTPLIRAMTAAPASLVPQTTASSCTPREALAGWLRHGAPVAGDDRGRRAVDLAGSRGTGRAALRQGARSAAGTRAAMLARASPPCSPKSRRCDAALTHQRRPARRAAEPLPFHSPAKGRAMLPSHAYLLTASAALAGGAGMIWLAQRAARLGGFVAGPARRRAASSPSRKRSPRSAAAAASRALRGPAACCS